MMSRCEWPGQSDCIRGYSVVFAWREHKPAEGCSLFVCAVSVCVCVLDRC